MILKYLNKRFFGGIFILQLILGRSGSGKTTFIRKMIKEKIVLGEKKVIVLVPEQNSFEAEKSILAELGEERFSLVEVLSFTRLADFIFRRFGDYRGERLSDGGRSIFMSMAIDKVKPCCNLYKKSCESMEFVTMMLEVISEFKMCGISVEDIKDTYNDLDEGTLKTKLMESGSILKEYERLIEGKFSDPLNDPQILVKCLKETGALNEYIVFMDSFNGFTGQQMKILELILEQASNVYITFCSDQKYMSEIGISLFHPVYKGINDVIKIAKGRNVSIAPTIFMEQALRYSSEELKNLEKNVFSVPCCSYDYIPKNICIYNASDIYDECGFASRTIRKLVMNEGYRFRDFAVVARSIDQYFPEIVNIFENYNIPCFIDYPEPVINKAVINVVFSAFESIFLNYDHDSVFRYLKTGLTGLSVEEISIIENYVLLWSIQGKQWTNEFTMHPRGFSMPLSGSDIEMLSQINSIRKQIITPLEDLKANISGKTGDELSRILYNFLEHNGIQENIRKICLKLIDSGDMQAAEENSRLWDVLIGALDQTAVALCGTKLSPKRYIELLRVSVQSADMSFIPQRLDEVTIGVVDRIRLFDKRVVFIVGAVDGEFPRIPVQSGAFSDSERKKLILMGLNMYDSLEGLSINERYLAYTAMASPSDKLYVSWPSFNSSGTGRFPSEIIREIKKIFPKIQILDSYSIPQEELLWSEKPSFELYARNFRVNSKLSATLKKYFLENDKYKPKLSALLRAAEKRIPDFNDPSKALRLFGDKMRISASQIEKYYLCSFQYFCKYGLNAKERKPASFNVLEYGTLIHFVLEKFFSEYFKEDICIINIDEVKFLVPKLLEKYVSERLGGWSNKSPRFKYLFMRCSEAVIILIKRIISEFCQSAFKPVDYELNISNNGDIKPLVLKLPDGGIVEVEGRVDRVDIMKVGDKSYIRIIDYKTGTKKFSLTDVLYGLNIQMLIYMTAIFKNGGKRYGNTVPAGVLYMPAVKPVVSVGINEDAADAKTQIAKKLRMNGLILDDPRVITGMEELAKGIFIPAYIKEGVIQGGQALAGLQEMGTLMKYIEKKTIDMATELRNGKISLNPICGEGYSSCDWCPYGAVCGFEDEDMRKIPRKLDKGEVIDKMLQEVSSEDVLQNVD